MKIATLLCLILLCASCEKDYNCTCSIKTTSSSGTIFSTERYPLTADKRKDAQAKCDALNYQAVAPGATATYSCRLD